MQKSLMKRIIDDIENNGCSESEVNTLLNYFEIIMPSLASTKASKKLVYRLLLLYFMNLQSVVSA